MLVDTHCHLDDPPLGAALSDVLARARAAGVGRVIVPGVRPSQWGALARLCEAHEELALAVGIHPQCLPELSAEEVERSCHTLVAHARALRAAAIGECGFDGATARTEGVSLARQAEIVASHCDAAATLGLPLIVHVVDAMGFALAFFEARGPLAHGAVLHAFGGPAELVPRWAALGFSFGIGPAITWERARRPKQAALAIPRERLLLETDGPRTYVAGAEARVGEPAQVREVLRALAALRGEDEDALEAITTENAERLFVSRASPVSASASR